MKITAEPRSDQWNADDFIGGPRVFTIANVIEGKAEQKYDIELVEGQGRVWRPPPTVVRLLMAAWGDESSVWVGRRVKLYRDESIRFGPEQVGGIRVSEMSDLPGNKTLKARITESRGKKKLHTVEPLAEAARPAKAKATPAADKPTPEQMQAIGDGFRGAAIADNAEKARFIAEAIGRTPAGWDDLSATEAQSVIDELKALTAPADEAPGFEGMDDAGWAGEGA